MAQDIRVFKSKRDVETAVIQLILEEDFSKLTIQQICQKALVSRSTFYSHYLDKYDVVEQLVAKTITQLETIFSQKYQSQVSPENLKDYLADIYQFYQENASLLKALLKTPLTGAGNFEEAFSKLCQTYINHLAATTKDNDHLPPQLLAEIFTANVVTLMKWIIEHGPSENVTHFADWLHDLFLQYLQE